jgi:hypothetical protein
MAEQIVPTVYFEKPGPANTDRTLEIAAKRARELNIKTVLVATTQGDTGVKAAERMKGLEIIAVTHNTGFTQPNAQELSAGNRETLEKSGVKVLTGIHAFGGVNRGLRMKLGTYQPDEIIAFTLRTLGQGLKVCVEISVMAADAGLVRAGEPCVAIAGTGRGADTAVVLSPAHAQGFLDLRIHEILCKPHG